MLPRASRQENAQRIGLGWPPAAVSSRSSSVDGRAWSVASSEAIASTVRTYRVGRAVNNTRTVDLFEARSRLEYVV